ncbi:MAG: hypothetical protein DME19_10240 [Verrucomicrobia bacterium]|nr:MAG: hypothetical protein DME19_10240 [Verrucomicrobiota bacterium]
MNRPFVLVLENQVDQSRTRTIGFVAPIHIRILEVFLSHEPRWGETPSSLNFHPLEIRARRSLAPPFMVPTHLNFWRSS